MENKEYTFPELKATLPDGEWQKEPDKIQYTDSVTKLPCLIVRNSFGSLCGYVGVAKEHPLFNVMYHDIDDDINISVHGGLTFSDFCDEDEPEHGICHQVCEGEDDKVWWFGFDCGHYVDLKPGFLTHRLSQSPRETYKNIAYVVSEISHLAKQLDDIYINSLTKTN